MHSIFKGPMQDMVRALERKNREIMGDIHNIKQAKREVLEQAHRSQRIMQMPPGEAKTSIVSELEVQITYKPYYHHHFPDKSAEYPITMF